MEIAEQKILLGNISKLSDCELLSIIGGDKRSSFAFAKELLEGVKELKDILKMDYKALSKIPNSSKRQLLPLLASFELSKRLGVNIKEEVEIIKDNKDVERLFMPHLSKCEVEEFWAIYLTGTNRIIKKVKLSSGSISATIVDIKLLLKIGIENLCTSVIVVHNHPSGDLTPSNEDIELTKRIKIGCQAVDISILDHIIIGKGDSVSLLKLGLLG